MQRWGPQPYEGRLSVLLQEFPAYTVEALEAADGGVEAGVAEDLGELAFRLGDAYSAGSRSG